MGAMKKYLCKIQLPTGRTWQRELTIAEISTYIGMGYKVWML